MGRGGFCNHQKAVEWPPGGTRLPLPPASRATAGAAVSAAAALVSAEGAAAVSLGF